MAEKLQIVWRNVLILTIYHSFALNGLYHLLTLQVSPKTFLWFSLLCFLSSQGAASGAHRLWTHRSYKATLTLRVLLCFLQTLSFQNSIHEWARDHRVHHKFTDTDADPHNSTRGFFFSHMGWLMVRKHPEVITKGKTVDLSDLEADPVVMFQKKYYLILAPIISFVIPTLIPWYYWEEGFYTSWCVAGMLRYMLSLHVTWLINSAAHKWGTKPYDKYIKPVENPTVSILTFGEGWHNYHHTFPWDYKAAELGTYSTNLNTAFIDFMAWIGWAYELKSASADIVLKRINRTGYESGTIDYEKYLKEKQFLFPPAMVCFGDNRRRSSPMDPSNIQSKTAPKTVLNSIYEWARDHRVHHKFTDTDADPHNSTRGFFFSHMGWLMVRKHPHVITKGKSIDMSDLEADPVVRFQKNYYLPLALTVSFIIPTFIPCYFWGESFIVAWCIPTMLRYAISLHCTWLINSAAHMWGTKPYDKYIQPVENGWVSVFAFGEGWHNYHHTFPWDYKAAELDSYSGNFSTAFIDFMAWIGWAYELKKASPEMILKRIKRTGSGNDVIAYDEYVKEEKRKEFLGTIGEKE
ncbi:FA desaturase domain containing protein, partial [Asbolus verrucosus]